MILILLGPPGAGKGTQGERITQRYRIPKISTGAIFRDLAAAGTPLGLQAKAYWSKGKLVPDEIVVGLVRERISDEDCRDGFILDGFPRTVAQADTLAAMLALSAWSVTAVLNFEVEEEALIQRLAGRRTCGNCGATYHVRSLPPSRPDICDHCGCPLIQRADDNPDSIRVRLHEYNQKTAPLLQYYAQRALLKTIDSNHEPDDVFQKVVAALEE
jgi:adenylate kinase